MKNVLIRGPLLNSAGYGVHSRQIFSYLDSKSKCNISSQVTPWGICPFYINGELEDGLIGKIINTSLPSETYPDVSFQIQLPNEWDPTLAKLNVGVTAGVETDVCSPAWIECVNKMDLVIVPSQHTKLTFERSGSVTTPIQVVPEYVIPEIIEKNLNEISKNWPRNIPAGIIHADLFPDNIFFKNNKLSGIIDYYFSCYDFYAFEIAVCLNALCFEEKMKI